MGEFANKDEGVDTMIGPGVEVQGEDGFAALGKPVPFYRRAEAYQHMKDMGCTDKDKMLGVIGRMSIFIERNDPHMALETALYSKENPDGMVDAIGCYRLLAVLLTAERPKKPHQPMDETIPLIDP